MNKKYVILAVLCLAAGVLVGLFLMELQQHNRRRHQVEKLPVFEAYDLTGQIITSSELPYSRRTAILFFSPDCEYCSTEMEHIATIGSHWDGVSWLFITVSDEETVQDFLLKYPVESIPDSRVLLDTRGEVFALFNVTAPPTLFVYDEKGQLILQKKGAAPISVISEWLK